VELGEREVQNGHVVPDPELPGRKSKVHRVGGSDLEYTGSNAKSLVSELTRGP
jgi:hypothetical protein